jgi:translation initiation factor 2A
VLPAPSGHAILVWS